MNTVGIRQIEKIKIADQKGLELCYILVDLNY